MFFYIFTCLFTHAKSLLHNFLFSIHIYILIYTCRNGGKCLTCDMVQFQLEVCPGPLLLLLYPRITYSEQSCRWINLTLSVTPVHDIQNKTYPVIKLAHTLSLSRYTSSHLTCLALTLASATQFPSVARGTTLC